MESQTLLILLFGLPAAGKSSISKGIMQRCLTSRTEWEIYRIDFDEDYERLDNQMNWTPDKWHEARANSLNRISEALHAPCRGRFRLILCDDNAWYASMRKEIHLLCKNARASFLSLLVSQNVEVCIARDRCRSTNSYVNGQVGEKKIRKMHSHFEDLLHSRPDRVLFCACRELLDEDNNKRTKRYKIVPWEEKHSYSVHSCIDYAELSEQIVLWINDRFASLSQLLPPITMEYSQEELLEQERQAAASMQNLIHRMDNALRRIIGRCMKRYQYLRIMKCTATSTRENIDQFHETSNCVDTEVTKDRILPDNLLVKFGDQKGLSEFFACVKKELLLRARLEISKDDLFAEISDDALEQVAYSQLLETFIAV